MIIVCYDTVKYLQLCVRNQTPGVRLRSALPVLCNLYLVPRKDITVTQVFYSIIIYIILIILYYITSYVRSKPLSVHVNQSKRGNIVT